MGIPDDGDEGGNEASDECTYEASDEGTIELEITTWHMLSTLQRPVTW